MKIIEIKANEFGGHDNQDFHDVVPEGWAIIHEDDSSHKNFPFGSFETEVVDGLTYMKRNSWVPGEMPEPEPVPEPEAEPDVWDELQAAYEEGVNSVD